MARKRQLARPPIKEALIDIQLAQAMPQQFAEQLGATTIPGYGKKLPVRFQQWDIQVAETPQTLTTNELYGWRFESDDGGKILQFRRNGIGFSVVKDYTDWNEIKSLARRFWTIFLELWTTFFKGIGEPVVNRLATRYINVMEVPISNLRFDDYLTSAPQVPEVLPQGIRHFFQRVEVPFPPNAVAIIVQTLDAVGATPTHLPIILDIDVQMSKEIRGDSLDIWTAMDTLREIKNEVFFSSVTERALESY